MNIIAGVSRRIDRYLFRPFRALMALFRRTHVSRWKKVATQIPSWDSRNKVIATLVPTGVSVLDIGAGAQTLRTHLKGLSLYTPCDLFPTTPDTLICDFNRGILPQVTRRHDFAICSGVLEYVRQPMPFLEFVRENSKAVILTYNVRLPGASITDRLANDWINHFTPEELTALLRENGFDIEKEVRSNAAIPSERVFVLAPRGR